MEMEINEMKPNDYETIIFLNGADNNDFDFINNLTDSDLKMGEHTLGGSQQNSLEIDISHMQDLLPLPEQVERRGPPDRTPFGGPLDFVAEVNSAHTNKKKYLFSHRLNRIYVDRETDFSVQFNWAGGAPMYVRATCVFADEAQAQKRVEQCVSHYHQSISAGSSEQIAKNVLHSSRVGSAGVQYCGEAHAPDSWLSVRVALAKAGGEPVAHAYKFVCKNSCSTGINRRAIAIVFTLEDHIGNVLGRQLVGARACACPRRDMVKDEETEGVPKGKRRVAPPGAGVEPPRRKIKIEVTNDDNIISLPSLQLTSPRAAITGLEVMINIEEQAAESIRDPQALERSHKCIAQLKQIQDELKMKSPAQ